MLLKRGMSGGEVLRVQKRLQELGFFSGNPGGNFGLLTEAAVRNFQASRGLQIDGIVGPKTWAALFGDGEKPAGQARREGELPPWLEIAVKDLCRGVREIPGASDNPYIVEAHQHTTLGADDDETPWCSAIMCLWMERAGLKSTRSAAAASWRNWGRELEYGKVGCVVVMSRPGGHHVGLYLGEDDQGVYVLGGNQDDMVSVRRYPWGRVSNFRWPTRAEGWGEAA